MNCIIEHVLHAERDNEVLNDIIDLTAKLTIMIVFLAKVAYLEELSLHELYAKLVECGFKLSEEDVSCEHEKMQNDETIIRQMCILFSLVNYSEENNSPQEDREILNSQYGILYQIRGDYKKSRGYFPQRQNRSRENKWKALCGNYVGGVLGVPHGLLSGGVLLIKMFDKL